jgi:hypothetical protein
MWLLGRLCRKKVHRKDRYTVYEAAVDDCGTCSLKSSCTQASKLSLARHLYEDALNRMQERITPVVMRMRRFTVEHPFATMKFRIFGHPRLLMRGLSGARIEIGLATMAYNIKRMTNVLGAIKLSIKLERSRKTLTKQESLSAAWCMSESALKLSFVTASQRDQGGCRLRSCWWRWGSCRVTKTPLHRSTPKGVTGLAEVSF